MVIDRMPLHEVGAGDLADSVRAKAELAREVNERTAIICGMADLLLEANGSLDQSVARAALESIKRHAGGLREVLQAH